ncbi:MAG: SIMPL domain-containing protein [Acidobacteriota bacterium]
MKKFLLAFSMLLVFNFASLAQESGNRVYGNNQRQRETVPQLGNLYSTEAKDAAGSPFIEAYVLLNLKPDEFIAVFGIAQEGTTLADSATKINAQIKTFQTAIEALGIKPSDVFVDFITQNRVYDYTVAGTLAKEELSGFETKKNIAVRYKDRAVLDKLLTAAAKAAIFDLIKVEYVISDMTAARQQLLEEAAKIIKKKEENYARLLNIKLRPSLVFQEKYNTFYPSDLYNVYTAYETGNVGNRYDMRILEQRKTKTFFYNALDISNFDAVMNPIGIEPIVQCTLYLKIKYSLSQ